MGSKFHLLGLFFAVATADWAFQTNTATLTIESATSHVRITEKPSGWQNATASPRGLVLVNVAGATGWSSKAAVSPVSPPLGETWIVASVLTAMVNVNVTVSVSSTPSHFVFSVVSVSYGARQPAYVYCPYIVPSFDQSSVSWSYLSGVVHDSVHGAAIRSLDPLPTVTTVGVYQTYLTAYSKNTTGLTGGRVALVVSPFATIRSQLQLMLQEEDVVRSVHGGPWALDSPRARDSYVFAVVTQSNVDGWISLALQGGIGIIHFNPGEKGRSLSANRSQTAPLTRGHDSVQISGALRTESKLLSERHFVSEGSARQDPRGRAAGRAPHVVWCRRRQ